LVRAGKPEQALRFTNALLAVDPENARSLALQSRVERDLGQYTAALNSGRKAYKFGETDQERYSASMAIAQALASSGRKFKAQFWLRRAAQIAPNPTAKMIAETDFKYVRDRSRLDLRFDIAARPSTNLNNGSSSKTLNLFGFPLVLSGDARALSGIETRLGAIATFRIAETPLGKTDLRFGLTTKRAFLSDAARLQSPTSKNADFDFTGLEAGLERKWGIGGPATEGEAGLTLGHNWYAGQSLSQSIKLNLGMNHRFSNTLQGALMFDATKQVRLDDADRSYDEFGFGGTLKHVLSNGDQVAVGLSQHSILAQNARDDHYQIGVSGNWNRAKPILGAKLGVGLNLERDYYALSPYSADGRQDLSIGLDVTMAFSNLDYMGFMPVLAVSKSMTRSNISLYDNNTLAVGLSVQSKF
jgi:tetratricopeptide (TPR) repeat protein